MKALTTWLACMIGLLVSMSASAQQRQTTRAVAAVKPLAVSIPAYKPAAHSLYQTIVRMDSLYFDTYNHSKPALMDSLTADDIEFYHDGGGLLTSKPELLQSIQKNIFGKVQRVLTPGTIEVYEIPGYGAIELGYHSFHNLIEHSQSRPARFIITWRLKNNHWQITKVVSLHEN